MPLIRVLKDNDDPLYFSSGQLRHLDQAQPGDPNHPEAKSILLFDRGDGSGLVTAWLKTSGETVAELVRQDSAFYGTLAEFEQVGGLRLWMLPQHLNGIEGLTPPTEAELEQATAAVETAKAAVATIPETDQSDQALALRKRVADLQTALDNRKSFAGLHSRLDLTIPGARAPLSSTYYLVATADEVAEALEPPKPVRPSVHATPVREPKRRRAARK